MILAFLSSLAARPFASVSFLPMLVFLPAVAILVAASAWDRNQL